MDAREDGNSERVAYIAVLSGSQVQVSLAYDALEMLLSTSIQKKTLEKGTGNIKPR